MASADAAHDESYLGLHCLYDGTQRTGGTPKRTEDLIHIVGVHGLGARPEYAWESKRLAEDKNVPRVNWLRDLLPQNLESLGMDCNYRIHCYNYSSKWVGQDSPKQHLTNIAQGMLRYLHELEHKTFRSAIILIGHSFGGIVIEQAIAIAHKRNSMYYRLLRSIGGVIFLGTPHRGSDAQKLGIVLARAAEAFNYGSSEIMSQLATDSFSISELVDYFIRIVQRKKIAVFCFFEMLPTDYRERLSRMWIPRQISSVLPKILGMSESSATLPGFDKLGLDADHSGLNKYTSSNDSNYRLVSLTVGEMVESCVERIYALSNRCDTILNWLCPTDPWAVQTSRKRLHQEGTGAWILKEKALLDWLSGDSRSVWIRGTPGAGKTVLMSFVIDEVRRRLSDTSVTNVGFAFHYFQFQDPNSLTPGHFIGSLVRQLCHQLYLHSGHIPREVNKLFHQRKDRHGRSLEPTPDELLAVFEGFERRFSHCLVAIDALDECPQSVRESDIIPILRARLQMNGNSTTGFLISSRSEGDIHELLDHSPQILLDEENIGSDIRLVVNAEVERLTKLRNLKGSYKSEVVKDIVNGAGNMFLYVKCQFDVCRRLRTVNDIRKAVKTRPKALDQLYDPIIEQIKRGGEKDLVYARRILLWLTFAGRALRLDEIIDAIAVEDYHQDRDEDSLISSDDILSICGSLVELGTSRAGNTILQLSHYTIAEYVTISGEEMPSNLCRFTALDANAEIARVCSRYLTFNAFRMGPCYPYNSEITGRFLGGSAETMRAIEERLMAGLKPRWHGPSEAKLQERLKKHPLLCYAADYLLSKHRLCGGKLISPFIDSLLHVTGAPRGRFEAPLFYSFFEVLSIGFTQSFWNETELRNELVRFACGFGTVTPLQDLETLGLPRSELSRLYHLALMVAIEENQVRVVDFVLDSEYCNEGNPVWSQDGLMMAIGLTDLQMVDYLLAKGAVLNVQLEYSECTPLSLACALGDVNTLLDFLERGAEVNAFQGLSLTKACEQGHHLVAEILLEHGANPNMRNSQGHLPLKYAITRGDETLLQVLIDHGAHIDCETSHDPDCTTLLQMACAHGHTKIVSMLIAKGAKKDQKTVCRYPTALLAAVANNRVDTVKELISKGVCVNNDVSAESRDFHEIVEDGDLGSHYISMKPWVSSQEKGRAWYATALEMACHMGHDEVVHILLEAGANPNAPSVLFGDLLRAACACGDPMQPFRPGGEYLMHCKTQIITMLLKHGAKTRSRQIGRYETVWHALLASNGCVSAAIFQLLKHNTNHKEWMSFIQILLLQEDEDLGECSADLSKHKLVLRHKA